LNWYEDDEFWIQLYPFLFPQSRLEAAPSEVELILKLVGRPVRAVLDLCCGPGRHSIALAKNGLKVTAVDRTSYYLNMAKERAFEEGLDIEWVLEDMLGFARPQAFDLVVSMFTSFGFFEKEDDDVKVLKNIRASLVPDGVLIMDVAGKEWVAENFEDTTTDELPDGSILFQRHQIVNEWRRIQNEWVLVKGDKAKTFRFEHTVYSGGELSDRLRQAGFSDVRLFGDLEGGEYGFGARRLIARAIR
jgi:SAM-dependent methyltransferase